MIVAPVNPTKAKNAIMSFTKLSISTSKVAVPFLYVPLLFTSSNIAVTVNPSLMPPSKRGTGTSPRLPSCYEIGMSKIAILPLLLALVATPALAADRATAITTLAGFYNSADVCQLQISKAKVDAYRDANTPANDTLFNVDVFRATQALYASQKGWTKDQTDAYCKTASDTALSAGVLL